MKHYLLSPEGLKRIADHDVEGWRLQGSFMKAEGPIMIPVALGAPGGAGGTGGPGGAGPLQDSSVIGGLVALSILKK